VTSRVSFSVLALGRGTGSFYVHTARVRGLGRLRQTVTPLSTCAAFKAVCVCARVRAQLCVI
jgi:hypothetical protein